MIATYRILSYILLFFALFLTMGVLMMLGFVFTNPAILLTLFIVAAVVLYSFSSYQFLKKGIDKGQLQKKSKKDFIKVNAYVAMIFAFINLMQSLTVILNPTLLTDMLKQIGQIRQQTDGMSADQLFSFIKVVLWVLLFYAIALGIHISLSFRLLRQYKSLFSDVHSENV